MRLQSVRHKHLRHRMSSCAHRDYWVAKFVGLFSIALNQGAGSIARFDGLKRSILIVVMRFETALDMEDGDSLSSSMRTLATLIACKGFSFFGAAVRECPPLDWRMNRKRHCARLAQS